MSILQVKPEFISNFSEGNNPVNGATLRYNAAIGILEFSSETPPELRSSGYSSGGQPGSVTTIDKFPFVSNANATDVGDLTQGRYSAAGQSSTVSGYTSGGFAPPVYRNTIDKFPFSANLS